MNALDRIRRMDADHLARWICARQGAFTLEERNALETLRLEAEEKVRAAA